MVGHPRFVTMSKDGHSARDSRLRIIRMRSLSLKSSFHPLFTSHVHFSLPLSSLFLPHTPSSLLPPSLTLTNKPFKESTDNKRNNTLARALITLIVYTSRSHVYLHLSLPAYKAFAHLAQCLTEASSQGEPSTLVAINNKLTSKNSLNRHKKSAE